MKHADIIFSGKIKNDKETGIKEFDYMRGNLVKELKTGKTFIVDLSHFDDKTLFKDLIVEVIPETVVIDEPDVVTVPIEEYAGLLFNRMTSLNRALKVRTKGCNDRDQWVKDKINQLKENK